MGSDAGVEPYCSAEDDSRMWKEGPCNDFKFSLNVTNYDCDYSDKVVLPRGMRHHLHYTVNDYYCTTFICLHKTQYPQIQ